MILDKPHDINVSCYPSDSLNFEAMSPFWCML